MRNAYTAYRQLVDRVQDFARSVRQRYPTQIACQAGCDGCCYQQFTIFPVEAHHLAQTVAGLAPEARQRLRQHLQGQDEAWRFAEPSAPCVLLHAGRCLLYDGRPLICRLHGYPLHSEMVERADGSRRDCCPLNFTDFPLAAVAPQAVYNLDLLNQTLAAINHCFVREGPRSDRRVTLKQAVWEALDDADKEGQP